MKRIILSKTVWFNVVTTIIAIAAYLPTQIQNQKLMAATLVIAGIGNIVLRVWFTNEPLTQFAASKRSKA